MHDFQQTGATASPERPLSLPTPVPDKTTGNLQRQRGGRGAADASERSVREGGTVKFGPFVLTTYAQLAAAGRFAVAQMQEDLAVVAPYSGVRREAEEWIAALELWQPYLVQQGEQALTLGAAALAQAFIDDGAKIREEIGEAKRVVVLRELRGAQAAAEAAAATAERLLPPLADRLRAAYRSGKESRIREVADLIGTVTDVGWGLHELSREVMKTLAELADFELGAVSKLTKALDKLNKGLAAFNLAMIILDPERKATQIEDGMRQLSDATGAFTALGTLLGLEPHIGLIANVYLVPMTRAILALLSRLVDQLHEVNKEWVELSGELMYPGAEPGDQEMFTFMVAVMQAASVEELPRIPQIARKYLVDHRDEIEAGAKEEVPTTGWWFWRRLDTREAIDWIFRRRRKLWAMLYGSTTVP